MGSSTTWRTTRSPSPMPPEPSPPADRHRRRLIQQRRRDTKPEILIRRELHRLGLRYRVDHPLPIPRRRADVVFPRERVAVFVDGCFWHHCPEHGTTPANNREWWRAKLEANVARDQATDAQLESQDWLAIRVWEHEDPRVAAARIRTALSGRRGRPASR